MGRTWFNKLFGTDGARPGKATDWPAVVAEAKAEATRMSRPAVVLDALFGEPVRLDAHSSLGGRPSMRPDEDWPLDAAGNPMIFLAQINYGEMPWLGAYPEEGLLSFFVADDQTNGCAFPSKTQRGFAVRFYEKPSSLLRRASPDESPKYSPLGKELLANGVPLAGRITMATITPLSYHADRLMEGWHPDCPTDLMDGFCEGLEKAKPGSLYYGGYPGFTQSDFRQADDNPTYSEVLLQLGCVNGAEDGWQLNWGDAGEACFMLPISDLADRRFETTVYYWDCR